MVFICVLGIFFISISISAFAVYSSLDEWEEMAYRDIKNLSHSDERTYIDSFIKMKLQKSELNRISHFKRYKIHRTNFRYLIMKRHNLSINQFYEKLFERVEKTHDTLSSFSQRLDKINPSIINLNYRGNRIFEMIKNSRNNSYRLINIISIMVYLKSRIHINGIYC
jgi:hypothetical protein